MVSAEPIMVYWIVQRERGEEKSREDIEKVRTYV